MRDLVGVFFCVSFFVLVYIMGHVWIFNMVDLDTSLHVCMAGLVVRVIDWSGGGVNLFMSIGFLKDFINALCRESST